jgi:hypothetical protein
MEVSVWTLSGTPVITRGAGGTFVLGLLPVVPMTLVSALLMVLVSLATRARSMPRPATLAKYF